MRPSLYILCTLLLLTAPLHAIFTVQAAQAAETLNEKIYDPGQRSPATDATPAPIPAPAPSPDGRVVPGQTVPDQSTPGQSGGGDTIIVVPSTPGQTVPDQNGILPVQPDTQKETPTIVVPAVPVVPPVPVVPATPVVPEIPKTPDAEKKDVIITPVRPVQPVKPKEKPEPKTSTPPKAEDKVLTPADFLPTTPDKKGKEDPQKSKLEKAPKETPQDKGKPEKGAPKAEKPEGKPDPKKDKPTPEKKKGEALRIPADAGKTGKMDFLEGCWKGRLSGRAGNEVIDNMGSRFCFDANGKGKHFLYDPKRNETCVGSANGGVKPDGTLRVDFDSLYCPSGETWYPQGDKYMTCRDGGNGADCKWYYKGQPRTTGPFYRD